MRKRYHEFSVVTVVLDVDAMLELCRLANVEGTIAVFPVTATTRLACHAAGRAVAVVIDAVATAKSGRGFFLADCFSGGRTRAIRGMKASGWASVPKVGGVGGRAGGIIGHRVTHPDRLLEERGGGGVWRGGRRRSDVM